MLKKLKEAEKIIATDRQNVIDALLRLSAADLMMFWGTERELIKRQEKLWIPIIKWLEETVLSQTKIKQTKTLNVPKQNPSLGESFRNFLSKMTDRQLAIFYLSSMTLRSILLAVAFVRKKINAEQAFNAAFVEELWQNEEWGITEESEERRKQIKDEILQLEKYVKDDQDF